MDILIVKMNALLDWLWFMLVSPAFRLLSRALELILLGPMTYLHLAPLLQIFLVGAGVALLSRLLRRLLRVEEKESAFLRIFTARQSSQQYLKDIQDWKVRSVLATASDQELDEEYNKYLAQRFALYGLVYLLPVFFTMVWLDAVALPMGSECLVPLPANSYGIATIPWSIFFFCGYFVVLLFCCLMPQRSETC